MGDNLVIVAIPEETDHVWQISSEKVPHLTILHLGDSDQVSNLDSIMLFVEHAASTSLRRFYLPVDRRGELGDDKADVLFFKKGRYDFKAVRDFRSLLLKDDNVKSAYDATSQFELPEHVGAPGQPWIPHLTLGYPESPAKPETDAHRISSFYDVQFSKIAVWAGNYEGPEWLLKDYWDDCEENGYDMDAPVGDMSMSALRHFGTKGMRWGVRNETISVGGQTQQVTARQAKKADKDWKKDFEQLKGVRFDDQKFTQEYNAKWSDHDFSKEVDHDPTPAYQKYMDGYFHEMSAAYAKQVVEHYGSSPTGKMRVEKAPNFDEVKLVHNPDPRKSVVGSPGSGTSGFGHTETDVIEHADGDTVIRVFKLKFNAKGFITGVEPVENEMAQSGEFDFDDFTTQEDSLTQTASLGAEFIEHYGTKGMRWGVRNYAPQVARVAVGAKLAGPLGVGVAVATNPSRSEREKRIGPRPGKEDRLPSVKTSAKAVVRGTKDLSFRTHANHSATVTKLVSEASKATKTNDLAAINAKHKALGAKTSKNVHLIGISRVPSQKAYREEVQAAYLKRLNAAADSKTNASGTKKYAIKSKSATRWRVKVVDVEHAVDDGFTIETVLDKDGFIVDFRLVEDDDDTLSQTVDLGAAFLAHVGVKGMKWGVRKAPPAPVTASARSVVPHGAKRKTKIKTEGGENHDASPDAIRVAQAHAKLKKSGTAALSNQELQDVQTRLNLERNVKQLVGAKTTVGRGRAFVKGLTGFGKEFNEAVNTSANTRRLVTQ